MRLLPDEDFSTLVGAIYDCALDPALWPETLTALRAHLGFVNASLDLFGLPGGKPLLNIVSGIDEADVAKMAVEYGPDVSEQWGGAERISGYPLEQPLLLSRLNPAGLTRANRQYADFGEPAGILDMMVIGLARDPATIGSVVFGRHRDAGPIGDPEIASACLFVPHLKRSVTISRLLEARAVRAATFEAALDGLTAGVMLVDASPPPSPRAPPRSRRWRRSSS